ncbi:MAG: dienelactone hydrolase family protein [Parvibaculaceae bacterium]|nr:dienelactone hydrolase family protein [Parvibaculaceae bacterium]
MPPQSGKAGQLVVLCHGYGSDGNDLIGLAPHWQRVLPGAAFVSPNAPEPCQMNPGSYQWFPLTRLDPAEIGRGVEAAAPVLNAFLDAELERRGLDGSRLVLVGFSQGTMMALHTGLRRAVPPAAIIGFSGALALPEKLAADITGQPPVLLVHGDQDNVLPAARMFEAVMTLGAAGLAVRWHLSHGLGHGIDPDGLELGGRFIADAIRGAFRGARGGEHWPRA